ncbi:hypothetical protein Tco_0092822 [Tanacetum coccineum]
MEKKDTLSSCSDSEIQQMQLIQDKTKESCMFSNHESNGTESHKARYKLPDQGNDAHVNDADIRPIYNEEPMAEVQTTDDNVSATGQQHTEQPEFNNEGKIVALMSINDACVIIFLKEVPRVLRYSLKYRYIVQSYRGRTQSLVAKKKDISENRASRNFDLMIIKWCLLKITLQAPFLNVQKTFDRSRSSLGLHGDDVCSHQFRPRSSSNDF